MSDAYQLAPLPPDEVKRLVDEFWRPRTSILRRASDIPRSCRGCKWLWKPKQKRWVILQVQGGCPWHGSGSAPTWAPGRRW